MPQQPCHVDLMMLHHRDVGVQLFEHLGLLGRVVQKQSPQNNTVTLLQYMSPLFFSLN